MWSYAWADEKFELLWGSRPMGSISAAASASPRASASGRRRGELWRGRDPRGHLRAPGFRPGTCADRSLDASVTCPVPFVALLVSVPCTPRERGAFSGPSRRLGRVRPGRLSRKQMVDRRTSGDKRRGGLDAPRGGAVLAGGRGTITGVDHPKAIHPGHRLRARADVGRRPRAHLDRPGRAARTRLGGALRESRLGAPCWARRSSWSSSTPRCGSSGGRPHSRSTLAGSGSAGRSGAGASRRATSPGRRCCPAKGLPTDFGWGMRIGAGGLWGGFGWLYTRKILDLDVSRTIASSWWLERAGRCS